MSNLTTFNPAQLPAFARKGELSEIAKALTGGGTGTSMKRISTKGGVFFSTVDWVDFAQKVKHQRIRSALNLGLI